jgi:DNA-directed RNA polymerase subunit beta'
VGERILGRVSLDDIYDPFTDELLVAANEQITEEKVEKIEASGIDRVLIRSVLSCRSKRGVCAMCYGRDLGRGHMVNLGEAIGIIAAQSIGEPGTQLTMRTFHIGGTASRRAEQAEIRTQHGGEIKFHDIHFVKNDKGRMVVMNRNGAIGILGSESRERERYPVNYGAQLLVDDGQKVEPGTILADWDPYTIPIVCEVGGIVKYGDIIEGTTMQDRVDPVTGKASKVIVQSRLSGDMNPRITIKDKRGRTLKLPGTGSAARYSLPVGSIISVNEGDTIQSGSVVGKIPRETTKTKDITGGLPRVAELFEVRKPKEHAVITEIDGRVSFGKDLKGKRRVVITPDIGESKEYLIPKAKHVSVHEGDYVKAGEPLMDGSPIPNDILRVLGVKELARFLVNEIQEFMLGEQVEWWVFEEENEKIITAGKGKPAVAEPLLLGVTKASLSTDSFISAASFQETTKVLTNAAMAGRVDKLLGLKENVIMGRLVPAGTGLEKYRVGE